MGPLGKMSGDPIEIRPGVRGGNNRESLTERERASKRSCMQMVLAVIEPPVAFRREIEVVIPIVGGLGLGRLAKQIEGRGAIECRNTQAALGALDAHPPVASARAGVIVAIIYESFDFDSERMATPGERV